MHENARTRQRLIQAFYEAREASPRQGWIYEHQLRKLVEEPDFALEILKEQGHIEGVSGKYRLTARGALAHEGATQED